MKLSTIIDEIRAQHPDADDTAIADLAIPAALAADGSGRMLFPAVHRYVTRLRRDRERDRANAAAREIVQRDYMYVDGEGCTRRDEVGQCRVVADDTHATGQQ